ncbi:SRPBCC domain-containing protein [Amycolatopsis arida]|nr:SRPBCC domain-containing protein [Amycolatopsis arida]
MDRIEREIVISAPPERVWAALTAPEFWLDEADPTGFELVEGALIVGEHRGHESVPQRIEKIEPGRYLAYRWANRFPSAEPGDGNSTLVEFTLIPEGAGTRLRMVESGFAALPGSAEERRQAAEDNIGGWDAVLGELRKSVEE